MERIHTQNIYFIFLLSVIATICFSSNYHITSNIQAIDPCSSGQMGGTVFNDPNANGTDDNDGGVEGVRVQLFGCDSNGNTDLIETVFTDESGDYHFTNPQITDGEQYRVEFSQIPDGYTSSIQGVDNGTNVQFVDAVSCDVNYGVIHEDVCLAPKLAVPCYINGDPENLSGPLEALVGLDYYANGLGANVYLANKNEIGSVWGVAYDQRSQILYQAAFLKRHVGLKEGLAANPLGAIYQHDYKTGANTLFLDITTLGISVGTVADNSTRGLGASSSPNHDATVFTEIGKIGLGDIDISSDGTTLFVMNLSDKTVYAIDLVSKTLSAVYPLPDPGCTGGSFRPFALKVHNDTLYAGGICDGLSSQSIADVEAFVYRLDGGSFVSVLNFPLDYPRTHAYSQGTCLGITGWFPWRDTFQEGCVDGPDRFVIHPQPVLSDIEFDVDGSMILGFIDRIGHQTGSANYGLTGTTLYFGVTGGDILRAPLNNSQFTIEDIASNGEFYSGEFFANPTLLHTETAMGSLALLPGSGEVATTVFDPYLSFLSGGVRWLSNTTGASNRGYEIYTQDNTDLGGKSHGLGDIELVCDPMPLQLGNYIWVDTNGDGIQDACEIPVENMTVKLYTKPGDGSDVELVATTATDASGEYYFTNDMTAGETWEAGFTAVEQDSSYYIVFCGDGYDPDTGIITQDGNIFTLTLANTGMGINPDFNDSDATEETLAGVGDFPAICVVADSIDHTLDVGLLPKPIVEIIDADITCGPVSDGGSITVSITGGRPPFTYDWSEDSYDGESSITNVPLGTYSITITDADGCTSTASADITEEPCTPNPCSTGQMGGTVFNDPNANGVDDDNAGLQSVRVQIFACGENGASELVETVYTDPNGDYHFTDPSIVDGGQYRIEFSNLPSGYTPSVRGPDNGAGVQFVNAISCDIDYGIFNPSEYCQDDPNVIVPCYVNGAALNPTVINENTIVSFPYSANTPSTGSLSTYPGQSGETGSVFGVAYKRETERLYMSAFIKRHSGLLDNDMDGSGDLGAIYQLDMATNSISLFTTVGNAGSIGDDSARGLGDLTLPSNDVEAFSKIGKEGLGDLDISEDGDFLYTVNLFAKELVKIEIATMNQTVFPIPDAGCANGETRPFGLGIRNGNVYVGTVCSAENVGGSIADLSANVYEFDGSSFTDVINFPLDYAKGQAISMLPTGPSSWLPWTDDENTFFLTYEESGGASAHFHTYNQPILSDLAFNINGDMVLGFMDRGGHQGGWYNLAPTINQNELWYYSTGGDILIAYQTSSGWSIESGGDRDGPGVYSPIPSQINNQGPGGGEFFHNEVFGGHHETAQGGLALHPHNHSVMSIVMDPYAIVQGGVSVFDMNDAGKISSYPIFIGIASDNTGNYGKAAGLGDISLICDPPPLQLGNHVWIDTNGDGIQDPCEMPVENMTVKLYTKPGDGSDAVLVATTVTDASGEYYFTNNTTLSETWEAGFTAVEQDSSYYIVFCGDGYDSDTNIITQDGNIFTLTLANTGMGINPDFNDSDATEETLAGVGDFPAICVVADSIDHTLDAGLLPKPDVALMMIVDPDFDDTGLSYGDSVKFRIVVYNQSLATVDSVDIIDYMPIGYGFNGNIPGNEDWSMSGGNLTTTIPNLIPPGEADSTCLYLTLLPTTDPGDWINVAEISAAYQGGVPVEDCDSPLNTDPMDNGGSEINTEADDEINGDGSATEPNGIAATDQDNVDPAAVRICDLALINTIEDLPATLSVGDTIKYAIIVTNQGTVPATNIDIQYTIPVGLTYLDSNNTLEPAWIADVNGADATITDTLGLAASDTVCIYLAVDNLTVNESSVDAYTTFAEISGFEDPDEPGVDKDDFDSTPDDDSTNDPGGNPDDDTDDETGGDGSGDPNDPVEDMDPALDEDDHDPAIIYVCDAATIIYTNETGPFMYGDVVKFNVVVYNQGNDTITNIALNDVLGSGLGFLTTAVNIADGWTGDDDNITTIMTSLLAPGESDTLCVELEILQIMVLGPDAYLQIVEITSFEDSNEPGVSKDDIDSSPDLDPNNDSGGNPDDTTDDAIDGDGSGDPMVPVEDTDPALDEDDHDPVLIPIFDLALDKKVNNSAVSYAPGDIVVFDITIYNQGNVAASSFTITDYLSPGFTFTGGGANAGWTMVGDNVEYMHNMTLAPGDMITIQLSLEVVVPANAMGLSDWYNYAEISEVDDDNNPMTTPPADADSNPDNDDMNDNNVLPGSDDDDEVNENGNMGEDEDDHDVAQVVVGFDLALAKTVEPGPYSYGDTLDYTITITNQGGLTATAIEVYDALPCGLTYVEDLNVDNWTEMDGKLFTTIAGPLASQETATVTLTVILGQCATPSETNYYNVAEISSFLDEDGMTPDTDDIDSTPDDDPDNDVNPVDNEIDENPASGGDEDDHDFEDLDICDLALTNTIAEIPADLEPGDTIKYEIVVYSQGNGDANTVTIKYHIPAGLEYLPINGTLTPMWMNETGMATVTTNEVLSPNESDTLCIYLEVQMVSTADASEDAWTTIAEISEYTDENDITKTEDIDSTPDEDPTNDPGGNPDDDTDNEIDGSGEGDPNDPVEDMDPALDEDDHDPAIVYICDVASIIDTEEMGPFSYGDTLKYFVEIHNQGNGAITNIDLQNLYGEGLMYVDNAENTTAGWMMDGPGELSLLYTEIIASGEIDTICLYMEVIPDFDPDQESWSQNVEVVSFEDSDEPGVSKPDFDSTPDDDPDNDPGGNVDDPDTDDETDGDGSGDPNDPDENTDPMLDEDDQDVEDIEICDAALINTIVEINDPVQVGDTVKYEVVVINQGNTITNGVNIDYTIPNGLVYLPINDGLTPAWTDVSDDLAQVTTTNVLNPGESDTLCIYLELINLPSDEVTPDSWTTQAEITSTLDEAGTIKLEDVDSTPDGDPTNDPGGNPDDDTDDTVMGDGTGDPNDPVEDMDPALDEDDHDPAIVYICDVASIIDTEEMGPFSYGDALKYFVEIHNQGNDDITNIDLQNLYGEGLMYVDNAENMTAGWMMDGPGELSLLYTEIIGPGEIDTICLYMEVIPDFDSSEESWSQNVEVVSFEDPDEPGVSKPDIDSTPDDDPDNDPGGNVDDADTDDETAGDGSGDPNDPDENTDPMLDEDDQDVEDIEICDAALINTVVEVNDPAQVGDTVKYEVIVINQGNTITNGVNIDYTIPNGLVYLPINDGLTPAWTDVSASLAQVTTTDVLNPGESDTLCIYLELINLPSDEVTPDSWTTQAEITSTLDEAGTIKLEDIDSTPDGDPTNDPGGNPDDDTDDTVMGDGTGDPNDPVEDMNPALDEDDHDPAIVYICDVASIIDTEEIGPFSYGDTLKYFVEIHNQGNDDITNIDLQNLYGEGLMYVDNAENMTAGWMMDGPGKLSLLYTEIIGPGEIDTICLYMEVIPDFDSSEESWSQNVEVVSFEDPDEPGVSKPDFDSTPDDDPDNDPGGNVDDPNTDDVTNGNGNGDPNDPDENTDPTLDEDDQDTEDIEICDLALVNMIMNIPTTPNFGDIIKYEVILTNQGNTITNGVNVDYQIPIGLGYLPINDGLVPPWMEESPSLASVSTVVPIAPGESDTICFYLEITDLPTPDAMDESWVTIAEITSFLDESGQIKTEDVDSTPDDDPTNDSGGNYDDETDNTITGSGEGDPNDPVEDMDPALDEDDHDPTNLYVCDAAAIIDTEDEGPFAYGDTIKYFVEIHNQGNGEIANILLQNLYGDGLIYLDIPENTAEGWMMTGEGTLSLLYADVFIPGEIDTICLYMEVQQDDEVDDDSWVTNVEIVSFEDPDEPGVIKHDVDSTPDDDPTNDPGGDIGDSTDDETSGNGTGDPDDMDTDPIMDEDDQDLEFINIFDLAFTKTLAFPDSIYLFGTEIEFVMTIYNQGDMPVTNVEITDYIPSSLTEVGVMGDNTGWTFGQGIATYTYMEVLEPGEFVEIPLFMIFQIGNGGLEEYINVGEISEFSDLNGNTTTDNPDIIIDADSTPDDMEDNDPGGIVDYPGAPSGTDNTINNENNDEDDSDPVLLGFVDLALICGPTNTQQVNPGEEITFTISITNQGTIPGEVINITNYIPDGLKLSDDDWVENGDGTATGTLDLTGDNLQFSEETSIQITLMVDSETIPGAYVNYTEVNGNFVPGGADITDLDIDSVADNDVDNDSGGNPETDTDNVVDGDGSGDPNDPIEDANPDLDEDDHDPVAFCVTPMPQIEGDFVVCPVSVMTYGLSSPVNPASTYTWSVTGPATIISGQGTGVVELEIEDEPGENVMLTMTEATEFDFCFGVTTEEIVIEEIFAMACNDHSNLSVDQNCEATISADFMLESSPYPDESFTVEVLDQFGNVILSGEGEVVLGAEFIGEPITVSIVHTCFGNSCWGTIYLEDKHAPTIECACPPGAWQTDPACQITCDDVERYLDGRRGTPIVEDNCEDAEPFFGGAQIVETECGEYILTQNWSVTTEGYPGQAYPEINCVNEYYVTTPRLADELECPDDVTYDCTEPVAGDLFHPDVTGYPEFGRIDLDGSISFCNISAGFDDLEIPACGDDCYGPIKVLRTWTILDWCTLESETCTQVIKIVDNTPPTVIADDITVSTDPWVCSADVWFDDPHLHDDCDYDLDWYIAWTNSGATLVDEDGMTGPNAGPLKHAIGVPKGTWIFVIASDDCCGNPGTTEITVTVIDKTPPVAIGTENLVVSLTSSGDDWDGTAKVFAESVDNGSHDNCSDVWIEIRRDSDNCDIDGNMTYSDKIPEICDPWYDNDDHDYGEFVKFCCDDLTETDSLTGVNYGMVKVWMRVWDDGNMDGEHGSYTYYDNPGNDHDYCELEDNYNEIWIWVRVEEKAPVSLLCPPDVTIPCHWDYTDLSLTGEAIASGTCDHPEVEYVDWPEIHCGEGFVLREWSVPGYDYVCVQRITIEYVDSELEVACPTYEDFEGEIWFDPFNPNHVSVDCMDFEFPDPWQSGGKCSLVGVNEQIDTFWFEADACFKAIKTWHYVDWCTGEEANCSFVVSLVDTQPPVVMCQDTCFAVDDYWDDDNDGIVCEMASDVNVQSMAMDSGDCGSEWIKWIAEVDLWYDGTVDLTYSSFFAHSNPFYVAPTMTGDPVTIRLDKDDISAEWARHAIEWKAFDGCGNVDQCIQYVEVADKKAPTPYCVGISTALMSPEAGDLVEIWAKDFNLGSFDNCTQEHWLRYSFNEVPPVAELIDEDHCFQPVWEDQANCIPARDSITGYIISEEVNNCNGYENGAQNPDCILDGVQKWLPNGIDEDGNPCKTAGMKFKGIDWCGEHDIRICVWDTKMNMDFCSVNLIIHGNACPDQGVPTSRISGTIATETGSTVEGVEVVNSSSQISGGSMSMMTASDGQYAFESIIDGGEYAIEAHRDLDYLNGVSTLDLVLIQKHILGLASLDSGYKVVAADINNDMNVSAVDLVELRKLILGIYTELPDNDSWRFVDADQPLNIQDPWPITEEVNISNLQTDMTEDFVAIKIGDVNGNVIANATDIDFEERSATKLDFIVKRLDNGSLVVAAGSNFQDIYGYQFTMKVSGEVTEIIGMGLDLTEANFGVLGNGIVTTSFASEKAVNLTEGEVLFLLNGVQSMQLVDGITKAEAYQGGSLKIISIEMRDVDAEAIYYLAQNEPNPFSEETSITFSLTKAGNAKLTIYDVTGKVIKTIEGEYAIGEHTINLKKDELQTAGGILHYKLESGNFVGSKRMIFIR